jgi:hypothetical protein
MRIPRPLFWFVDSYIYHIVYGWRSAEVENLARMRRDFPATEEILLEQNYRSTGSILAASLAIVEQGKSTTCAGPLLLADLSEKR